MKLKSLPEDFRVTELTDFRESRGSYAWYLLTKRSLGTPEAIQAILQNWNLSRQQVSYGGLKDRHAETKQYVTIANGPKSDLEERNFRLEYRGQSAKPFGPHDILANDFEIVLRGYHRSQRERLESELTRMRSGGIVNYFDDQRFGSLGISGDWIGRAWCKGDYERALYLAIAEPNQHDRPREREQKEILRQHWGNWIACKDQLDRSHRRSIVTYLCDHPTDFRRAIGLVRIDLRSIYVAAFQSYLWNRWLSSVFQLLLPTERLDWLDSRCGRLAVPLEIDAGLASELRGMELPLPSARIREWPTKWKGLLDQILEGLEMTTSEIRLKYPRDTFFSKGSRACWTGLSDLEFQFGEDALHEGRMALKLRFTLPKGCYATMLVKQLTQVVESS